MPLPLDYTIYDDLMINSSTHSHPRRKPSTEWQIFQTHSIIRLKTYCFLRIDSKYEMTIFRFIPNHTNVVQTVVWYVLLLNWWNRHKQFSHNSIWFRELLSGKAEKNPIYIQPSDEKCANKNKIHWNNGNGFGVCLFYSHGVAVAYNCDC